ncbi:MAG: erythromycin esterase family protein [Janthinobacterium lividum]
MATPSFLLRAGLWLALLGSGLRLAQAQATAPNSAAVFAGVPQQAITSEPATQFPALSAEFYAHQLFLLGEAHGVQRPQELDLALFEHLNERAGVRIYVAEMDCAQAYYLNRYLRTGDEATLALVFRSWTAATSQWANQDLQAKFQRLRAWNHTLPRHRQVRFLGLDDVQDQPLLADYLTALVKQQRPPQPVRLRVDSLISLLRQPVVLAPALATTARRAGRALGELAAAREARYDDLRHALANLTHNPARREQNLFTNFEAYYRTQHLEQEKLYGFWGLNHVLQSPLQGGATSWVAQLRRSSLPVHDRIVSLLCVFADCQMLVPSAWLPPTEQEPGHCYTSTTRFNHDGPLVVLAGISELKQRTQLGSTTLFDLTAPAAATRHQPIQVSYPLGAPLGQALQFRADLPATAYVQYLLLVRNSLALRPLQP